MRTFACFIALLGAALLTPFSAGADEGATPEKGTADLAYRTYRKWKFHLPVQPFKPVSGAFDFSATGGGTFETASEGDRLRADLDGDGELDVTVEGDSGVLAFEREDEAGNTTFKYAVRLKKDTAGWTYAAAGAMVGKIGDTKIQLIDMNGNGVYTDVGFDGLVVGYSRVASFLPEVASVDGELYRIRPTADGSKVEFSKYAGPVGTLDMKSSFDTSAKLMELVLVSADRRYSYDLSTAPKGGVKLPMGQYLIQKGTLGLGSARVTIIHGRADTIIVMPKGNTTVKWGGPIRAELEAVLQDGKVVLDPSRLAYFGRFGERYVGFTPMGKSPEFTITDTRSKEEIAKAIFTGC